MLVGWPARADVDWLGLKNFLQAGESWDFLQARLVQLGGYCRRLALPLINLAYLLAGDQLL
jgi:hypothetical protein